MNIYKTRPIGEIFEWHGVKLQVVEKISCKSCYFYTYKNCLNFRQNTGYCGRAMRNDDRYVIFKRINNE